MCGTYLAGAQKAILKRYEPGNDYIYARRASTFQGFKQREGRLSGCSQDSQLSLDCSIKTEGFLHNNSIEPLLLWPCCGTYGDPKGEHNRRGNGIMVEMHLLFLKG
jgi:hypothetical protein